MVRATLDSFSAHIALMDASGEIVLTKGAWRRFARANGTPPNEISEGINYLKVCDWAGRAGSEEAATFAEGQRGVLDVRLEEFAIECPCHSATEDAKAIYQAVSGGRFREVRGRRPARDRGAHLGLIVCNPYCVGRASFGPRSPATASMVGCILPWVKTRAETHALEKGDEHGRHRQED